MKNIHMLAARSAFHLRPYIKYHFPTHDHIFVDISCTEIFFPPNRMKRQQNSGKNNTEPLSQSAAFTASTSTNL